MIRKIFRLEVLPLSAALIIAIIHFGIVVADYRHLFVHPDYYRYILPEALKDGPSFGLHDVINSFQLRSPGEFRPRFLAYFIEAIDQKLRLRMYEFMPVHPTVLPINWFLQLIVAPYLLYRLILNLTARHESAVAGIAVYLTGTGFLSGFTMGLLQGKTLSNLALIAALYVASILLVRKDQDRLLYQTTGVTKYVLLFVLYLGLFLDELPVATFFILPLVCWSLFVPRRYTLSMVRPFLTNGLFLALALVGFLATVVLAVPLLTDHYFGFKFDYLGNTLVVGENKRGAISFLEGPRGGLTPEILLTNFTTQFGISLAPRQTSPMIKSQFGDYPDSQVNNLPKVLTFLLFFGAAFAAAWRASGLLGLALRGLLGSFVLYFVFLGVLLIRHLPLATGFYYGALFASMFALLIALLVGVAQREKLPYRIAANIAVLAIVLIQIDNFHPINDGWIVTHNEILTRPAFKDKLPLTPPRDLSASEVHAVWSAWKQGELDAYLEREGVSTAAAYLVFELRAARPE